jgi:hypothetical protein
LRIWLRLADFFNPPDLIFADPDLAAETVELDHSAFFPIALNDNTPPIF